MTNELADGSSCAPVSGGSGGEEVEGVDAGEVGCCWDDEVDVFCRGSTTAVGVVGPSSPSRSPSLLPPFLSPSLSPPSTKYALKLAHAPSWEESEDVPDKLTSPEATCALKCATTLASASSALSPSPATRICATYASLRSFDAISSVLCACFFCSMSARLAFARCSITDAWARLSATPARRRVASVALRAAAPRKESMSRCITASRVVFSSAAFRGFTHASRRDGAS